MEPGFLRGLVNPGLAAVVLWLFVLLTAVGSLASIAMLIWPEIESWWKGRKNGT